MSGVPDRQLVGGVAAACAVCCAAPIVGILGVAGVAATAVTLAFAGVVFATVVGLTAGAAVLVRRSRARRGACALPWPDEHLSLGVDVGPEHPQLEHRDEPLLGIGQVDLADLRDPPQSVPERVRVEEERC